MIKRLGWRAVPLLLAVLVLGGAAAALVIPASLFSNVDARSVSVSRPLPPGSPDVSADPADSSSGPSPGVVTPDLFVVGPRPLTPAQVGAVRAVAQSGHVLFADAGSVRVGHGSTVALGVDPAAFRAFTPPNTARVDALWQSIAAGDIAVAHTVARSQHVPLGGTVPLGGAVQVGTSVPVGGTPEDIRVGAFATTGLPGVGMLVNQSRSAQVGLVRGAAAVVGLAPGADLGAARTRLVRALPGVIVAPLRGSNGATAGTSPPTAPAAPPAPPAPAAPGRPAPGGAPAAPGRPAPGGTPAAPAAPARWVMPAPGPVVSGFAWRDGAFHQGLDIGAPLGAPIWAAADGVVVSAGPAGGFGNAVVLTHAGGVQTVYGHMRYWFVRPGQRVRAGQQIALVGSEGRSTGPHLHFEVHVNGTAVDPAPWLTGHGVLLAFQ